MKNPFRYLPLLILLLSGCNETDKNYTCPRSYFTGAFPKRSVNLARRLGDTVQLEIAKTVNKYLYPVVPDSLTKDNPLHKVSYRPYYQIDTIRMSIDFDRKSRTNTLINIKDRDTIFHGLISIYRGLYYLTEKKNDTIFWIGAMNIDIDSIQGLGPIGIQMCDLEDYLNQHPESKLIQSVDTSRNAYRLRPDKKLLKQIYPAMIKHYAKLKIISDQIEYSKDSWTPIEKKLKPETQYKKVKNIITESIYPVPASDYIDIDFTNKGNYIVQLIDNSGRTILSGNVSGNFTELAISSFKPGFYILQVYSPKDKMVETHRVIIK